MCAGKNGANQMHGKTNKRHHNVGECGGKKREDEEEENAVHHMSITKQKEEWRGHLDQGQIVTQRQREAVETDPC